MRSIRTAAVALSAVLPVALLAGCGAYEDLRTSDFAEQDGAAIVAAASEAMRSVTSMRVTGQLVTGGTPVLLDLSMGTRGRCTGTLRSGGDRVAVRRLGRRAWVRGDAALAGMVAGSPLPAAVVSRASTAWAPTDERAVLDLCDLGTHLRGLAVLDRGERDARGSRSAVDVTVAEETAGGERVVRLATDNGDVAWVRSDAPHLVVRTETAMTRESGSFSLSEFDHEVRVEAPRS